MENNNVEPGDGQIVFSAPINNQTPAQDIHSSDEKRNPALHFFLYLVLFLSLAFVTTGVGVILYQIINKNFPDTMTGYPSYSDIFAQSAVKFGLASIIITTPIFFVFSFLITKYLYDGKILENSKVRKWMTYIVLFVAIAAVFGDLNTLVFNWLNGDMATRFVLKVFVILLITASVFGYYFWDMHKKNIIGVKYLTNKIAGVLSFAIIIAVFSVRFL